MKISLVALMAATSAFAQAPASITAASVVKAACGPKGVHYDVMLDKAKHTLSTPKQGEALVYFVQDIGTRSPFGAGSAQVTVVGIDGAWVGANQNESWFAVPVEPGEHHVCVSARTHVLGEVVEFANFTAEAGRTYFFRTRDFMWQSRRLQFAPADSDQAKYMIASYPMAISNERK